MNLFKTFKLTWWQAAIFKLCTISVGILLAIYFRDFFTQYLSLVWIVFVISTIWIVYIWYRQK